LTVDDVLVTIQNLRHPQTQSAPAAAIKTVESPDLESPRNDRNEGPAVRRPKGQTRAGDPGVDGHIL
jgi:hypothetical protein